MHYRKPQKRNTGRKKKYALHCMCEYICKYEQLQKLCKCIAIPLGSSLASVAGSTRDAAILDGVGTLFFLSPASIRFMFDSSSSLLSPEESIGGIIGGSYAVTRPL